MIRFIVFILACASFIILAIPNFSKADDPIRLGSVPPQQILDPEPILELQEESESRVILEPHEEHESGGFLEEKWIGLDSRIFLHVEGGLGGSAIFSKSKTETGLESDEEENFYAKVFIRIWGLRYRGQKGTNRCDVFAGFLEFRSTHDARDLQFRVVPLQIEGVIDPVRLSAQFFPFSFERKIGGPYRSIKNLDLIRLGAGLEKTFGEEIPVKISFLAGGSPFGRHRAYHKRNSYMRFMDTPDGPVLIPPVDEFDTRSIAMSVFGELAVIVEPFTLELGAKYLIAKSDERSEASDAYLKRHDLSGYSRLSVEFLGNFRAFVEASYEELFSELSSRELSAEFITVEFGVLGFHH